MTTHKNLLTLCVAALLTLGLAACGSDGSDPVVMEPDPTPPPDPGPTAYEAAKAAIAAAATAEAAQAAYNGALGDVTGAEAAQLLTALNERIAELATMARAAEQRMELMTAAGMIDTSGTMTAEEIAAANAAIAALEAAIAAAADVDDTSMYQAQVDAAKAHVMASQGLLDHAAQTEALDAAVMALMAIDLSGLSTQEAIDAANTAIAALQAALEAATELSATEKTAANIELAAANRAVASAQGRTDIEVQKMAIDDAVKELAKIDLADLMTQDDIDAAQAAIMALQAALNDATDLSESDKLDGNIELALAERAVTSAQETLDENRDTQTTALKEAGTALAAINLDDLDTAEKITEAKEAVEALKMALEDATHLSDEEKAKYQSQLNTATETVTTADTGMDREERRTAQMEGLTSKQADLNTALAALAGDDAPTQVQIDAADAALAALKTEIEGAEDLTDAEKSDAMRAVAVAEGRIAGAKQARRVADAADQKAADDKAKADAAAMAVTAAKLYAGIGETPIGGTGDAVRTGAYGTGDNVDDIAVTIGTADAVNLSEDKDTPVADNHGWEGKMYTHTVPATAATDAGSKYEAVVYSNVEAPTMGRKFGAETVTETDADREFQYDLDSGALTNTQLTATGAAMRIALSGVTRTAGTESFNLPTPNPQRIGAVTVSGSFHGVSGTYSCATTAGTACTAAVAADGGFTLAGGTAGWTFTPSNPNARVRDAEDIVYASVVSRFRPLGDRGFLSH